MPRTCTIIKALSNEIAPERRAESESRASDQGESAKLFYTQKWVWSRNEKF
jgi:hypothetical protein